MTIKNFVLIIGAMKCGTTSLFNYLAEHPQIAPCKEKEPSFFSAERNYRKGFEYYQNLWDWQPEIHQIALEGSTSYTRVTNSNYVNAAENIAKLQEKEGCKFKFIYVMRNPLDRIESQYTHGAVWRSKELKDSIINKTIDPEAVDVSKYSMQIEEYYSRFDAKDILLINFNDLKNKPIELLNNICHFLQIDSRYQFKKIDIIHNGSQEKMRIELPGWYLIRHTPLMKLVKNKTPSNVKEVFYRLFKRQVKDNYIKLSSAQKKAILCELEADLKMLDAKYEFDISRWNFDNLI